MGQGAVLGFNEEESFVIREEGDDEVGELLCDPPPLELEDSQELKRFMFPEEVVQVCARRGWQGCSHLQWRCRCEQWGAGILHQGVGYVLAHLREELMAGY